MQRGGTIASLDSDQYGLVTTTYTCVVPLERFVLDGGFSMADVNLNWPLSGAVEQWFRIWQTALSTLTGQVGFINIYNQKSSKPDVEKEIVSEVASYGKQLGRIEDAIIVLLNHTVLHNPDEDEVQALYDLARLLKDIADVRDKHRTKPAMRPKIRILSEYKPPLAGPGPS